MILPTLHHILSSRVVSTTPLLFSEEEERTATTTVNSEDEDEVLSSRSTQSFPDSDISPSRCSMYNYSVAPFAHVKSEGRDNENEYCSWKLDDFTATSVNVHDHNEESRSSSPPSCYLGSGKFGTVQLFKERSSSRKVALKTMNKRNGNAIRCLLWKREVEIQTRLSHPNIVRCLGYFQDFEQLHMVLEYASLGSLAEYGMNEQHTIFAHQDKKRLVLHVTSALAHLQTNRIAHRDVKTENVLVCMDTSDGQVPEPMAKLADFGYAIYCGARASPDMDNVDDLKAWRTTLCGTLACLPPEMLEEEGGRLFSPSYHALSVDAWSLGVLAYELIMDQPLFTNNNSRVSLKQAISQFQPNDQEIWSRGDCKSLSQSTGFVDFCAKLLERDPTERFSPAQALDHAWLKPSTTTTDASTSKRKRVAVVSPLLVVELALKKRIQRRRQRYQL